MKAERAVLDASVTAAWLLPDESSDAAQRAYAQLRRGFLEVHAPEIWLWECGNIIANSVKQRRMTPPDALIAWGILDAVRSRVEMTNLAPSQLRAALALALDLSLSIYDAGYLWLALSLKLPLLTHDRLLAEAARRQAVEVLTFDDIS